MLCMKMTFRLLEGPVTTDGMYVKKIDQQCNLMSTGYVVHEYNNQLAGVSCGKQGPEHLSIVKHIC